MHAHTRMYTNSHQKRISLCTLPSLLLEAPISPQQLLTWLGYALLPQLSTALHTTGLVNPIASYT